MNLQTINVVLRVQSYKSFNKKGRDNRPTPNVLTTE